MAAVLVAAFVTLAGGTAFAATIETEIDPPRVYVGDSATLRVKISGAGSAEPGRVPAVSGLDIAFAGTSRSFQWINGRTWSGFVLNFSVSPVRAGTFTIPPIEVRADGARLTSRQVTLVATGSASRRPDGGAADPGTARIGTRVELSKKRVFAGEPLIARYSMLYAGLALEEPPSMEQLPSAKGFVQRQVEETLPESAVKEGGAEVSKAHIATFVMVPTVTGKAEIGGGSAMTAVSLPGSVFSFPSRRRVTFESQSVEVLPLPEQGKPDNYSGNVGQFALELAHGDGKARAFSEYRVKVKVRGKGNLLTLSQPAFESASGVRVIVTEGQSSLGIENNTLAGEREFVLAVIPEKAGAIDLGAVAINCFNPASGRYETVKTAPVRLNVSADASGDGAEQRYGSAQGSRLDFNWLIIALVLIGVAVAAVAVVAWERRRFRMMTGHGEEAGRPRGEPAAHENARERYDAWYREMVLAQRGGFGPNFMRSAEKALGRISDEIGSGADAATAGVKEGLEKWKQRLYAARYGGMPLSEEEARGLQAFVKEAVGMLGRRR